MNWKLKFEDFKKPTKQKKPHHNILFLDILNYFFL